MIDPQSWQREWARQLREENRWRRKALHRQPGELQARIAEKVPETVRDTLTAAFGAAFSAALAGEPLLRRTASPKAEAAGWPGPRNSFGRRNGSAQCGEPDARRCSPLPRLRLCGARGWDCWASVCRIFRSLAASLLRSLGQIARGYGYITSTRKERRIMLLVLDAALTGEWSTRRFPTSWIRRCPALS